MPEVAESTTGLPHTRRVWMLAAAATLLLCSASAAADPATRPNILLIVADDLGYADIGVHGCRDIPTPHIDSIARNGSAAPMATSALPSAVPRGPG